MADDKVVQITLSAKNLTPAEFERARQQLSGIKAEAAHASDAAGKMGKMLAGAFSVAAIKSFATGLLDTADQLVKLSDKTGIGIEALQQLEGAATQGGNTLDDVTRAIADMQVRIAGEDKGLVKALGALGLSMSDLRTMRPEDQFTTIAGAISKVHDPADQAKLRVLAFGKAGKDIAGTLAQDFDAIEASVVGMSDETARRLDAAGDTLQQYTKNIQSQIAEWLVASVDFTRQAADAAIEGFMAVEVLFKRHIADMYSTAQSMNIVPGVGKKLAEAEKYWRDSANETQSALGILIKKNDDFAASLKTTTAAVKPAARSLLDLGDGADDAEKGLKKAASEAAKLQRETEAFHISQFKDALAEGEQAAESVGDAMAAAGDELQRFIERNQRAAVEAAAAFEDLLIVSDTFPERLRRPVAAAASEIDKVAQKMGDVIRNLGSTLKSAFEGGGGIAGALKSLGAQIGDALAGSLLDELAKQLEPGIKSVVSKLTAGIKGIGWLGGGIIGAFAAGFGLVNRWMDDSLEQTRQEWLALEAAMETAREAAAKAKADRDAEIKRLGDEIVEKRKELSELQDSLIPTWDDVKSAVERYGLSIDGAGQKVQQMKVKSDATALINDWEMLTRAGWDIAGLADGMKEELSAMVGEARKYGVELPSNMKPILESMIAQGRLTDDNGEKLKDLSGIKFGDPVKSDADIIKDAMGAVVEKLEELIGKFTTLTQESQADAERVAKHWEREPWADWRQPDWPSIPGDSGGEGERERFPRTGGSFATGTAGRYVPFGYRSRVDLHGDEAVVPRSGAGTLADDIAARLSVTVGGPGADVSGIVAVMRDELAAMRMDLSATLRGLPRRMRDQMTLASAGAR